MLEECFFYFMSNINGTIASGGNAQDGIAAGNNFIKAVIQAGASDIRFNIGAPASSTVGEVIPAGQSATVFLMGQRLSIWGANTNDDYSIRPSL